MGRKSVTLDTKIAIKTLLSQKFSPSEIARDLSVSRKCVYNIKNKVELNESLGNKPGQGRPRCTTQAEDRYLVKKCKTNRTETSRCLASELSTTLGKQISPRTIRRRLFDYGLKSYTKKLRPFRNKTQKKKRLDWCKKYKCWNRNDWGKIVFSDESHFEIINRKNRYFVRRTHYEGEQSFCFQNKAQGGGSVSVWGCFSANGIGVLRFYEGRLNSTSYVELVSDALPPYLEEVFGADSNSFYFQQDNAPCHKARNTMEWFRNHNIPLLDWPPTSPDANPIENLWAIIDRSLINYTISTASDLKKAILDIWSKITIDQCVKLVHSMPNRVLSILRSKGGNISKY